MNDNQNKGGGAVLLLAATTLFTGNAIAQTVPAPQEAPRTIPGLVIATPTPMATQVPVPVPTGPVLGVPTALASPTAAATAQPSPAPTPAPRRILKEPRTPSATPTPADRPTPMPTSSPTAVPVPVPSATTTPVATPSVAASPVPDTDNRTTWPWMAIGAGLAVLLAMAAWAFSRRRAPAVIEAEPIAPVPVVAPPPPTPAGPRARIDMALRPLRAGLNMLSAVVEAEVVVTNVGDAPAAQIRIHATMLSAHAAQQTDLDATFAAPPTGRPASPPFALAPGEERRVRAVAALSREAVRSMEAGGRLMFVPLVAMDVRYAADAVGTSGRTGQAFIVGIERVDSAKLAPFWLDGPLRMHDQVAARAQGHPYIA
ncbi:hypothetical protein [uncultured Sphingomonas sp.]|uniref:hypothetical protein n=1 Tax=uncultured Sphingomonas sp. TaxID=158754 RepID=UPI0035CBAB16